MPKVLSARAPQDAREERQVRKLAASRHAPGDWIRRARMIVRSWEGARTTAIAADLGCHPQTVRERRARFTVEGLDGLGDRPGAGRKPRRTEAERSAVIALVATPPPGRLRRDGGGELTARDEERAARWTLDAGRADRRRPGPGHRDRPQPGAAHPPRRTCPVAPAAQLGDEHRPGVLPKRTTVVTRSTDPPVGATTVCVDELGPVIPRTFPPAPGWSSDGHRSKAPLEYSRGPEKTWVYGALRVRDGQALTFTAPSRNSVGYRELLEQIHTANPDGDLYVITDNRASHKSPPIQAWLAAHPRVQQVCIPVGACWLNLREAWGRLVRRAAFAGQTFADPDEIAQATRVATKPLNRRAKAWVWGRPLRPPRHRRHTFVYRL